MAISYGQLIGFQWDPEQDALDLDFIITRSINTFKHDHGHGGDTDRTTRADTTEHSHPSTDGDDRTD